MSNLDPALAPFARDERSALSKALGDRGVPVKVVDDFQGVARRFDGVPLGLRLPFDGERTEAVGRAARYLLEKCGFPEEYLYGSGDGKAELDLEIKVRLLAISLVDPAPPYASLFKGPDDLRAKLYADEIAQLYELFVDHLREQSPIAAAQSAEEVEAVIAALGKGTIPPSRLTSFDLSTLRSIVHSLAIQVERLRSGNSSPTSHST